MVSIEEHEGVGHIWCSRRGGDSDINGFGWDSEGFGNPCSDPGDLGFDSGKVIEQHTIRCWFEHRGSRSFWLEAAFGELGGLQASGAGDDPTRGCLADALFDVTTRETVDVSDLAPVAESLDIEDLASGCGLQ